MSARRPAASAAFTTSVKNLVPQLVPPVSKRVLGSVTITNVQSLVDRYVTRLLTSIFSLLKYFRFVPVYRAMSPVPRPSDVVTLAHLVSSLYPYVDRLLNLVKSLW